MTSDQARKLLGGYATNSLTEAERTALFEAALDDQELFDALQHEEALKDLLADPASRTQVQQALATPASRASSAWWSRGWLWGGLAGAVAAAVLMVAVIRSNQQPKYQAARLAPPAAPIPAEPSRPAVPAPTQPKSRKLPAATRNAVQTDRELQPPAAALATPAPPPPPQPAPAAVPQAQSFRREDVARARAVSALSAGTGGIVADLKAPLLQYSLVKRDLEGTYSAPNLRPEPGDLVRLRVSAAVAGYLSLSQFDPQGDWKRLFPAADQGLLVAPNIAAIIPDSPIVVTDREQKFRLTLVRADTQAAAAPLTVDITIGPGKAP